MKIWPIKFSLFFVFIFTFEVSYCSDYTTDTATINVWLNESKTLLYSQPDSANTILDSVLKKSFEIDYQKGIYSAYTHRGIVFFMLGKYRESIQKYSQALEYANPETPYEKIRLLSNISYSLRSLNLIDSAILYNEIVLSLAKEHELDEIYQQTILDLAYSYMDRENYIKSAIYYHQVIDDIESSTSKDFLLKSYSSLAMFFYRLKNIDKAYTYFRKAIEFDKGYDEIDFLSVNYNNLGLLYQNLKYDYDSAIYFYRKALEHSKSFKKENESLIADINIGNCYLDQGKHDSAFICYQRVVNNPVLEDYPKYQAALYTNIGMNYLNRKNLNKARNYLNRGLKISTEINHLEFQQKAYLSLYKLDSIRNNNSSALEHYKSYHQITNLLKIQEVNNQIAILDYEKFLAKEKINNELLIKENQNQNQKIIIQQTIIAISVFVVLVLIVVTFIVVKNRSRIDKLNTRLISSNNELEELNTKLQHQRSEMKDLLMSKDRFVSILGHDLKNPFVGLLGLLELIQEDWDKIPEKDKIEGIQQLHQSSIQTYQLLEELLDWGKTQQGLIRPTKSKIQIIEIFNDVKTIFQLQSKEKQIDISIRVTPDAFVETDKKLFSQIIQNFFGNAIKYSYTGTEVILSAFEDNGMMKVCVTDQGIGIPDEKIDSLFNLDKHFNRPGTQNEKSTGMGLILCKEYANIIDAKISVESKVNSGSTFCLILPLS